MNVTAFPESLPPCPAFLGVTLEVTAQDKAAATEQGFLGRHSHGRYALREGLWTLLDVFAAEGVQVTFFADPGDALLYPQMTDAIVGAGHELALLGSPGLAGAGAEGLEALAAQLGTLRDRTGTPITGFRAGDGRLSAALMLALSGLGIAYDSSFYDDDRPYVFDTGDGRAMAELPVYEFLSDAELNRARHPLRMVEQVWDEELCAMYDAGAYLSLSLSCRADTGSGRMSRARAVGRWIAKARRKPGVDFLTGSHIAQATIATCTAEPTPGLET